MQTTRKQTKKGRKYFKNHNLDSVKGFRKAVKEIIRDYKSGKTKRSTAHKYLLRIYHMTYKKNNSKIRHLSNSTLIRLRAEIKEAMNKV